LPNALPYAASLRRSYVNALFFISASPPSSCNRPSRTRAVLAENLASCACLSTRLTGISPRHLSPLFAMILIIAVFFCPFPPQASRFSAGLRYSFFSHTLSAVLMGKLVQSEGCPWFFRAREVLRRRIPKGWNSFPPCSLLFFQHLRLALVRCSTRQP